MKGKKGKLFFIIFCIIICCLIYQFFFPEEMSSILGKHMKHTTEITITLIDNEKAVGYTTSDDAEMAQLKEWGSKLKCRISSFGNNLFSKNSPQKKYVINFVNGDGSMTSLSLSSTGEISESIKRYKIVNFNDSIYENLNNIIETWDKL